MRVLEVVIAGLAGLTPGVIIFTFAGENLFVIVFGFMIGLFGLVAGVDLGRRRHGWLTRRGLAGAVIGLIPGIVLWPLDLIDGPIIARLHWNEVASVITMGGFLIGLAVGNLRRAENG